jgi:hypothetical protein
MVSIDEVELRGTNYKGRIKVAKADNWSASKGTKSLKLISHVGAIIGSDAIGEWVLRDPASRSRWPETVQGY